MCAQDLNKGETLNDWQNGNDDEHLCKAYGLLESLSVDMLSCEEKRRLAEHLKSCKYCRQECASMYEIGVYDDMPFYDRIRAYEANPAAETDEYWKSIAFAFRPELAMLEAIGEEAKRSLIERISAWVADAWKRVVDEVKGALAWLNGEWPGKLVLADAGAKGLTSAPKTGSRRLIYSAALMFGVATVGVILGRNPSPEPPVIPNVGDIPRNETGVRGIVVVKGMSAQPSNAGETQGATNVSASYASDPTASANAAAVETLKCLEFDFGSLSQVYREGKRAFDAKDYSTAAASFDELANTLAAEEKIDVEALSVARWNLAVATIRGGDVQTGVGLLKALLDMRLDDEEMNARVNDAIKTFEK